MSAKSVYIILNVRVYDEREEKGMKKKIVTLLIAGTLALSITACGGSSDSEENTSSNTETKEDEESADEQKADSEKSDLESYVGKPLADLMGKISELGYTAEYYDDGVDFTEFISDVQADYSVDSVDIDTENKTLTVEIVSNTTLQNRAVADALSEKLSTGAAWVAAENYGESQYPYGFELHYLMGKLAEEPYDENTWFLKAECTVTNEFGAEAEGTCEATVTGTEDAPQVTSFNVY